MEKQDAAFSKSVMEIRKQRKIKSRFLMFARLSSEKGSADDYHAIKKKEQNNKESKLPVY